MKMNKKNWIILLNVIEGVLLLVIPVFLATIMPLAIGMLFQMIGAFKILRAFMTV